MEGGLPLLNCLLQQMLRSLCGCSDSSSNTSSKWVYAVFWRVLPRNYPPPKWDYGGGALDRDKGNKRNWILVWEDGFCDFYECERAGIGYSKGRFGADIFFKLSHEVYSYGEGLVGKVAAANSHKWVFGDSPKDSFITSWNVPTDPQPRAWEFQFNSGIQTIAVVSVKEGIVQLGSFHKIVEDLNLVMSIQTKFSYLQSIPGIYAIQRPYLPIQHPYLYKPNIPHLMIQPKETSLGVNDWPQSTGAKRLGRKIPEINSPSKSINIGYNSPQNGAQGIPLIWPIPTLLSSVPCSLGALLSRLPSAVPSSQNGIEALEPASFFDNNNNNNNNSTRNSASQSVGEMQLANVKVESSCLLEAAQADKPTTLNFHVGLENGVSVCLEFGPPREERGALNLN